MKHIKVVIGANFGDEGKGMMTHYFSKNADNHVLNVLFNGGCQRGHTVMNHVFHCFGSGYFDGSDTYYHKQFMVDPIAWALECNQLNAIPILYIHPMCRVVTPYDVAINQAIETKRGKHKHGSCGMGIWESDLRSRTFPIFYKDLYDELNLYKKIGQLKKEYYPNRLKQLGLDLNLNQILLDDFFVGCHLMINHCQSTDLMKVHPLTDEKYSTVIFEGGQGLLLDEENKQFSPHVTASSTGSRYIGNLIDLLYWDFQPQVEICYVSRSYITRHGAGELPYEVSKNQLNPNIQDKTNVPNPWQDSLRYGQLNINDLVSRILEDSNHYSIPIKQSIAFTHMNYSNGKIFTLDGLRSTKYMEAKFQVYKFFNEYN